MPKCGFIPTEVPEEQRWWRGESKDVDYCDRKIWKDSDYCFWHAQVYDKPTDELESRFEEPTGVTVEYPYLVEVDFGKSDITGSVLRNGNFAGSDLSSASIEYATYEGGNFSKANLAGQSIQDCNFRNTLLSKADFSHTTGFMPEFRGSDLSRANFSNVHYTSPEFENCVIEYTDFSGATISLGSFKESWIKDSKFFSARIGPVPFQGYKSPFAQDGGIHEMFENKAWSIEDFPRTSMVDEEGRDLDEESQVAKPTFDPSEENLIVSWLYASDSYSELSKLHADNSNKTLARKFFILSKECRRIFYRKNRNYTRWVTLEISRFVFLHGESPWRVVGTSVSTIVLFTLLFPIWGIRSTPNGILSYDVSLEKLPFIVGQSGYFSTVTFTTLGYGDLQPIGWAKAIASVESFIGALLLALLVFVLGRRTTW